MESKLFFETFNTIKADEELRILFENVVVKKVSVNINRTLLRVFIFSDHLIEKKDILKMERKIEKQVFNAQAVEVKIIEEFSLSSQYNAKTLYEVYNDSILLELKEMSPVLYTIYKKAVYIK